MQGDEYEHFKNEYCVVDKALSAFFYDMKNDELPFDLQLQDDGDVEYIDKIIWIFYKAKASILNF